MIHQRSVAQCPQTPTLAQHVCRTETTTGFKDYVSLQLYAVKLAMYFLSDEMQRCLDQSPTEYH